MTTRLEWTTAPPTKAGRYFYWPLAFNKPTVVEMAFDNASLVMWGPKPLRIDDMKGKWWPEAIQPPPK